MISRLVLDFRRIQENIKMSSSLSKILETGMNVFKSDFRIILELYLNNIFMLRYLYEQISKIDYMASLQNFRSPLEHTLSLGQFSVVLLHTNFVSYLLVRLLVTCSCGSRVPQNDQVGIFV